MTTRTEEVEIEGVRLLATLTPGGATGLLALHGSNEGGTAELAGFSSALRLPRRETLARSVQDLFPAGGDLSRAAFWTGLRPMTPDGTPIVGGTRVADLFTNPGHGPPGHGLPAPGRPPAGTEAPAAGRTRSGVTTARRHSAVRRLRTAGPEPPVGQVA